METDGPELTEEDVSRAAGLTVKYDVLQARPLVDPRDGTLFAHVHIRATLWGEELMDRQWTERIGQVDLEEIADETDG